MALTATLQVDKTIRFKFTGALSAVSITDTDLLDLLCVAATTTSAYKLASAIKLRRLEMWVDPVAGGSLASIEDIGAVFNLGGPSRIKEDTTLGVTRPAHVVWRPANMSVQSVWLSESGGNQWLSLTSSGAGYLDVHMSFVLQDGESPNQVGAAVAGATVGQLYIRALDSNGSKSILPVAFVTI